MAAEAGCVAVLVDTFDKAGPGLFTVAGRESVADWVNAAHRAGLPIALAGRLSLMEAGTAAEIGADVVAVRSIACRSPREGGGPADGDRMGRVDREAVGRVRERIGGIGAGPALSFLRAFPRALSRGRPAAGAEPTAGVDRPQGA